MALLEVQNVFVQFDTTPVLHGVSLEVEAGEIVGLLGPSGCGKTTLMRVIAGLQPPQRGHVYFDGRLIDDVPVHQREFGLMFQEFALFPHKNVYENVVFGLRMAGWDPVKARQRVAEVLQLVGLAGFETRDVTALSGGERQRVALARSLAPHPRLLMLDEPLGALDRILRDRLMVELRHILKNVGLTAVYVTHDQEEAFTVADRVLIMQAGSIVQRGTPEMVYRQPATPFVAQFLGLTNLIPGQVVAVAPLRVETVLGRLQVEWPAETPWPQPGDRVVVLARPEAAQVVPAGEPALNIIAGQVTDRSFRGGHYQIEVQPATGPALRFELHPNASVPALHTTIRLALPPDGLTLLRPEPAEQADTTQWLDSSRPQTGSQAPDNFR